ncbi:hypothetical protein Tco_0780134 [Tanacetum coccineum]
MAGWDGTRISRIVPRIMGEPLSLDSVFDFPMDEPHPAPDFFALAPLPEARGYGRRADGVPSVKEVVELVVETEEEQVIAPVVDAVEGKMDALMMEIEEDLAVLFGDDDFEDEASDGFGEEEVWEVNKVWLMAPTTLPPVLAVPPPSVYEVGGPYTVVAEGPSFPQGSDAEIAAGVIIGEIGPRVLAVEGKIQVMASQMIQVVDRVEYVGVQVELGQQTSTQRDETVTGLTQQMSSKESTLMRCILGLEKRIAALERRPPGPKNHAMSNESSPLKRLVIEINVWVKLPKEEKYFYPITDTDASDPTLIDYMERFIVYKSGDGYEDMSRPSIVGVLVEAEMVSPEVESEKWRRPLLHWMYDALNVSTDGREEDFFPRNGV